MTIPELEALVHADVRRRFQEYLDAQKPPVFVVQPPGTNLQAALDDPSLPSLALVTGEIYAGAFTVRRPVEIFGRSATLKSVSGPALYVVPGTTDVFLQDLYGLSPYSCVFQLGDNGPTQTTLDLVPRRITLERCHVPTHRGQRAFEVNSMDTLLLDCVAEDVWAPSLADSQGVFIMNTPGNVTVRGGSFCAGSEPIMVGGDPMDIPGVIPTNIVIEHCRLWRPLSWKTDGVKRAVKTGLELKTGYNVMIRHVNIDGCWKDAQDGWAMTFTPRSGGAIRNVIVEDCVLSNVGGGFNITGHDEPGKLPTPTRTTGITVRNTTLQASKAQFGGRGILCQLGMSPETVDFETVVAETDGTHLMLCADGAASGELKIGRFRVVNSNARPGSYGIQRSGGPINGADVAQWIDVCQVEGNTFTGATAVFKTNFPANHYV